MNRNTLNALMSVLPAVVAAQTSSFHSSLMALMTVYSVVTADEDDMEAQRQ